MAAFDSNALDTSAYDSAAFDFDSIPPLVVDDDSRASRWRRVLVILFMLIPLMR